MTLDESKDNAEAVDINGIELFVDDQVKNRGRDQIIDYMDNLFGKGFYISRADNRCG